jgi:hypothetical protein
MDTIDPQPMIEEWSDVKRWLRAEATNCTRRPALPASVAIAFHAGRVSAIVETSTFCVEDANLITDELCRFPWSARIRGLFDARVPPIHDSALITPCDDRFVVFFHPDGPYASSTPLFGFN